MKIRLLWIGKTSEGYLKQGIDNYIKRLSHYVPFELVELSDVKNAAKLTPDLLKQKEGEAILNACQPNDHLVLLDEKGKQFTSMDFASYLQQKMNALTRNNLVFVIGGAYGFSSAVYQRANGKVALSGMTFSHQMVRLIFLEQLYRGMTILKGESYHHQ